MTGVVDDVLRRRRIIGRTNAARATTISTTTPPTDAEKIGTDRKTVIPEVTREKDLDHEMTTTHLYGRQVHN